MDVTCERCGTEYEFDETLLSARGTSVKCTNCGQVFKVFPKGETLSDRTTSLWRLKLKDGSIDTIDTLRELQRRIAAGELSLEDEIARGEEEWRTLGSIPELDTFFQAAGVSIPSRIGPSPIPPAPTPTRPSSTPPHRRPRQPTLLGVSPVQRGAGGEIAAGAVSGAVAAAVSAAGSGPAARAVSGSGAAAGSEAVSAAPAAGSEAVSAAPAPEPASEPVPEPVSEPVPEPAPVATGAGSESVRAWAELGRRGGGGAPPDIEEAEFEERPRTYGSTSARPSTPPPAYYDDDDDIPALPGRGGSPLSWLLLIVAIGGLALFATQWQRVTRLFGLGSNPASIAAGVAEGDAGLAEGHPQGYASAIETYRRAVEAGGETDPEILAKLSNAYALAAQAQLDEGAPAERAENLIADALSTARQAAKIDPRNPDALLATADALRLSSELVEARDLLEEARSIPFSRTAELFRVDARLSAAEANGDLSQGLRSAEQAVELAPQEVRYQLLLARAEHAASRDVNAKAVLAAILEAHPGHPVATRLMQELEAPATAVEASDAEVGADAGAAAESVAAPEPAAGTEPLAAPAAEPVPAAGSAAEPVPAAGTEPVAAPESAAAPVPAAGAVAAKEAAASAGVEKEKPAAAAARRAVKKEPRARSSAGIAKGGPAYDEYDRLAEAAADDAFVDGRPPVRDYDWYMRQGRAELAAGNYSRARALFDSALEANPGSADAMDGLGYVSTGIEDFDSALRYFRAAAQRGHPDGYFNLGKTYERLGKGEEAVSAYYTYITRRPSGAHAAAARAAIKTLEPRAKLPPEPEPEPDPTAP